MIEIQTCGQARCAPILESQYWIRCSACGLSYGRHDEESTVAYWNYHMKISQDNIFDRVSELQWEHNKKPFFVGKISDGFWVKDGRKFEEYPE